MSIYTGSHLVTCIKTLGGNHKLDLVRVVGGSGISSVPWQVLSLITSSTYVVTAAQIVQESYRADSLNDAIIIYTALAGKAPELLTKQNSPSPDPNDTSAC
jgi:hypothetical protein